MKNKDKIKTKAGVILIALLMIIISIGSVLGGTVTNTDVKTTTTDTSLEINYAGGWIHVVNMTLETDNQLTRIVNSNGNSWAATGANIQVALDDLNASGDPGGTVNVPKGTYAVSDSVQIYYNMTLDMHWGTIKPDADFDVVLMYPHSTFQNAIVDVSDLGSFSNTSACLRFINPSSMWHFWEGFDYPRNRNVRDVTCKSKLSRGIGLLLYPEERASEANDFAWNEVESMKFFMLNTSIKLKVDYNYNYVNFNRFTDLYAVACSRMIWLDCDANEISGNTFKGIMHETESIDSQKEVIWITGKSLNNHFLNVQTMDWSDTYNPGIRLTDRFVHNSVANGGDYEWIEPGGNVFEGMVDRRIPGHTSFVYDNSIAEGFQYNNTYRGKISTTLQYINISSTSSAAGFGINPWQDNGINGVSFYQKTPVNPYTYFYGNEGGADHYGAHRIDSAGNWDFITESGNINFAPSTGLTEVVGNLDVSGSIINDAIFACLSSSVDQTFAATGTGYNITFNTNDEINGITHSTTVEPQNITIVTSGVYTIIAQPQVHAGAGASGYFHMWLRKDTGSGFADVANTNVELTLASNDEDVIPLIVTISLNAGDVIRINASVAHTDIELDAQTPANEPAIPSIIFSMYRIGS